MKFAIALFKLLGNDWTEEITIAGLVILGSLAISVKPEITLVCIGGLVGYLKRGEKK